MNHISKGEAIFDQQRSVYVLTTPENPPIGGVLMVHGGLGGTKEGPSDLFVQLAESFADAGIASLRFDMLGAGESDGDYADMTIAREARQVRHMHKVLEETSSRIGIVAESMGATALLLALPLNMRALVLLWPAFDLPRTDLSVFLTPKYQNKIKHDGIIVEDGVRIGARFVKEFQELGQLYDRLALVKVPTLIIHGLADSDVPIDQSQLAIDQIPGSVARRLIEVPGGGHGLRLPDQQSLVADQSTDWLSAHLRTV